MKKVFNKIINILSWIFGYGIFVSVAVGGLSFLGYIVALIVGGEVASSICYFIYKTIYPYLVYGTSIIVVLGILIMYMRGEVSLTVSGKKKTNKQENKQSEEEK